MPEANTKVKAGGTPAINNRAREKTKAAMPVTSLAQIDASKKLSQEEMAMVAQSNTPVTDSVTTTNGQMPNYVAGSAYPPATGLEEQLAPKSKVEETPAPTVEGGTKEPPKYVAGSAYPPAAGLEEQLAPSITPSDSLAASPAIDNLATAPIGTTPELVENNVEAEMQPVPIVAPTKETSPDAVAATPPTVVDEKAKQAEAEKKAEEEKKKVYIQSIVGDYNPKKGVAVNLGKDVAFVQEQLLNLGILPERAFNMENATGKKQVDRDDIALTILAINTFQKQVVGLKGWYGYILPGRGTIKKLVSASPESVAKKMKEYQKRMAKEQKEAAKKKSQEERKRMIELIKKEPATKDNVKKHYDKFESDESFGHYLKDFALHNPKFVEVAYDKVIAYKDTDEVSSGLMEVMTDSELASLTDKVDALIYDSLDWGWTTEEEYALMKRLRKGKEKPKEQGGGEKEEGKEGVEKEVGDKIPEKSKEKINETGLQSTLESSYGKEVIIKAATKIAKEMRDERPNLTKGTYDAQCIDGLRRLLFDVSGSRELYGKGKESYNIFHHPDGGLPTWKTSADNAIDFGITKSGNWTQLKDLAEAMAYADKGAFVITTYHSQNSKERGHVNVILGGTSFETKYTWNKQQQPVPKVFDTGAKKRWPDSSEFDNKQKITNAYGSLKHPLVKFYYYNPPKD